MEIRAAAIRGIDRLVDRLGGDGAALLRSAVGRALGTVPARIDVIAEWLHLHPRTLQRRLAREGTSFQAILDEVRKNAAHRLLTGTDMPFSQVASMVELAGQAALTRAVRRWFGRTPSQVRREAGHPHTHPASPPDPAQAVAQG
ncbi:helix-turn-helix transcriptional regulator [Streptomyces sp. ID05-04B]|uniref:helix-turn-helix transcriptional regulator n=1 Tax=unclassified Streptomyces TaxID=2593676 RepID=UPI0020B133CE|nr:MULTISPECIES: helix-turn-helix transcriptional regulator [unclassified Streptomyces]MDX5565554.1 helix-turn-helix transcriptional regulator [Streptomyces sp. ID05-04B]